MPRFEHSALRRFWEITLDGTTVFGRWSHAGADGRPETQEFSQRFKSVASAKAAYDKIVADKLGKGYLEVEDGPGADGAEGALAWNEELEAAVRANPDSAEARLVYADWLQAHGNPLGELIALQYGNKKLPANLIKANLAGWVGAAAARAVERGGLALEWKKGFIEVVALGQVPDQLLAGSPREPESALPAVLEQVLRSHVGGLVRAVTIGPRCPQGTIDRLAHLAPGSVVLLEVGGADDSARGSNRHDLSRIWRALPGLEAVALGAGVARLGAINAPSVRRVRATEELTAAALESIRDANWPALEHLSFVCAGARLGDHLSAWGLLPRLRHLGLLGSTSTEALIADLAGSKLLRQLDTLDLSKGTLTDEGAAVLLAHRKAFKHLRRLVLDENLLSAEGVETAMGLGAAVQANAQREPQPDPGDYWMGEAAAPEPDDPAQVIEDE